MKRQHLILSCVLIACNAHADELGRLFHTPEQRAAIDRAQQNEIGHAAPMLNGIVQRGDGTRTIWIDGVPQNADGQNQSADSQPFPAADSSHRIIIKVGEPLP
ncbi:MAG: hypothetical protein LBE50_00760 [Gallionellaceae bacterium]|jgi:hypothetical protein|nr:hypothetical protein [Gallionellaceae bacterium]